MEPIFFFFAFLTEIAGTIAGFGSSTLFLPIALFFFDFRTALTLVALMHLFGNIGRVSFFRHGLNRHILLMFGIPSVLLTIVGALLVVYLPSDLLKNVLGTFLVIYASIALWKDTLKIKVSLPNTILGGGLSGFIAGLIGTGGAIRGAFLTAFGLSKEKYIATSAAVSLVVDATRIPIYFSGGFLQQEYYWYIPLLFVIALAGSFIGKLVVRRIPQKRFKKIVLLAILIIGVKFIFD